WQRLWHTFARHARVLSPLEGPEVAVPKGYMLHAYLKAKSTDPQRSMAILVSRWCEMTYQSIGALRSVAAITNVSPRDSHGSFDPLTLHKRCRCTLAVRASDEFIHQAVRNTNDFHTLFVLIPRYVTSGLPIRLNVLGLECRQPFISS